MLLSLGAAGCGSILDGLGVTYNGPRPSEENIVSESVVVRSIRPGANGGSELVLDRVRYLERDRKNVNRVIQAYTAEVEPAFTEIGVRVGDRLLISTRFANMAETGDLESVPDWAGNDYLDYPIARHALTAVTRAP